MRHFSSFTRAAALGLLALAVTGCSTQRSFSTPEAAANELAAAVRSEDRAEAKRLFGPRAAELRSGDPEQDRADAIRFARALEASHQIRLDSDDTATLLVGEEAWPFSVPLVRDNRGWRFDTDAGLYELEARRIGRNELKTIQACRTLIDAQREYFSADRDGDGAREYAAKLLSEPGLHDGLYWEPTPGGIDPSPIGPAFARAAARTDAQGERLPFYGYRYKVLTRRGPGANGGSLDYATDEGLTRGWAAVAFPDEYDVSGVMTFLASDGGEVFERDLGPDGEAAVAAMDSFDPTGWTRLGD